VIAGVESKWLKQSVTAASGGRSMHTNYRVRVMPQDGEPEFESEMSAWGGFANYGNDIHDFRIRVVYDPDAPEKCEVDKDWLHSIDLTDWFGEQMMRRHRAEKAGGVPSAFPASSEPGSGSPGEAPSPETDPAAYWRQYAQQQRAAFASAAASSAPAPSASSPEDRLAEVEKLHQAGALSDAEYQAKRQQIIDSI
jgi:hypothetical protein